MIENEEKIEETYHVFILKEEEAIIDSTPPVKSSRPQGGLILLVLSCLALIGSLTILPSSPISQQETVFRSLVLPTRTLPPVTLRQTISVLTTGRKHQDATRAHGYLVFFNGSFSQQDIPANMVFTAANGVQVVTDETVSIPAGNPPNYGQVSVSAHALVPGVKGNVPSYSINTACCALSVKAINESDFTGGKDARDFHTVRQSDIDRSVSSVTQSLYRQAQKALQMGLTRDDIFVPAPCNSAVSMNRRVGQEAVNVMVTVAEACSAIAYSRSLLLKQAQKLIHIPRDFRVTSLLVHVISTTSTGVTVLINCSLSYNPTRKGWVK